VRALLIAIIASGSISTATTIALADDVDWKFYGGASVENTPEFCFFDAKSVIQ